LLPQTHNTIGPLVYNGFLSRVRREQLAVPGVDATLTVRSPDRRAALSHQTYTGKEATMRLFECGSLVPGCEWHTRADNDAEIVRRVVDHMRETHGETVIRENMIDNIKARITDESKAA
jgi:predicted small metal-binding protein